MRLTAKRLTEIQARAEAATEGPWGVDGNAQCGPEDSLSVYPVRGGGAVAYMQPLWDDAKFIAHAREDIPALLAEIDRLRGECQRLANETKHPAWANITDGTVDDLGNEAVERMARAILQQSPPEVPERIEEWPEDDTHLQGELWLDWTGHYVWIFEPTADNPRRWVLRCRYGGAYVSQESRPTRGPFTRATDPSLPRTWDTLDDVPEDVERATGDYAGTRRKLARSSLCESGWLKGGPSGGWVELPVDQIKYVKNIREGEL